MKKNLFKTNVAVLLSVMMFSSCQKSNDIASVESSAQKKFSFREIVSNPQFEKAYQQMEEKFMAQNRNQEIKFIAPFFTNDGFGVMQNVVFDPSDPNLNTMIAGQSAYYGTDLGPKDFYRKNNDGTVSVHINSKNAYSEHYDIATDVLLNGNNGNLNMSYTGPVVSYDITDPNGNVLFTINFIDWLNSNRSAVSFHGTCKVRQGITGPQKNLVSRMVANPGWTQTNIGFNLN